MLDAMKFWLAKQLVDIGLGIILIVVVVGFFALVTPKNRNRNG